MGSRALAISWFSSLALLLGQHCETTLAGWEADGGIVCYATGTQQNPVMAPDGTGGAVIAWEDRRDVFDFDVYAQRVDSHGRVLWTAQGVAVCTSPGDQTAIAIAADGVGGAFLAWQDARGDDADIVAQRIDADGTALWTSGGLNLCNEDYDQAAPVMVPDGEGGVIIVWTDSRGIASGLSTDVYAQRVAPDGTRTWATNGVGLDAIAGAQRHPALLADGSGGAFLAWDDSRDHTTGGDAYQDIYAGHVNAAGGVGWTVRVLTAPLGQTNPRLCSDGSGGMLVFWSDSRGVNQPDIRASRVAANGAVAWPTDTGRTIVDGPDSEFVADLVVDGSDGVLLFWYEGPQENRRLMAQRFDADLQRVWIAGDVAVCDSGGIPQDLHAVTDGAGGAVVVWVDDRSATEDLYAQHVSIDGTMGWTPNGRLVCGDAAKQLMPAVCADDAGGALFAWHDQRRGTPGDIFGHHVAGSGALVPVLFASVGVACTSEGVEIRWTATGLDASTAWDITRVEWPSSIESRVAATATAVGAERWRAVDTQVEAGASYTYRVRASSEGSGPSSFETERITVPASSIELSMPQPNPFRSQARFGFRIPRPQHVTLTVHDLAGRRVAVLRDGLQAAGWQQVEWNGRDGAGREVAAGRYILRLETPGGRWTRPIVRIR